jgi:hypothetical protein
LLLLLLLFLLLSRIVVKDCWKVTADGLVAYARGHLGRVRS